MNTVSLYRRCDFHLHTRRSPCAGGEMRLSSILAVCEEMGVECAGLTDHIFSFTDPRILSETRDELESIETPLQVFLGCEADVLCVGKHLVTDEMVSSLDYIAIAANHFHMDGVQEPPGDEPEAVAGHLLDTFRYACSLEFADVIVHPLTLVTNKWDKGCLDLLTNEAMAEALEMAKRNNVAIELSPRSLDPGQMKFRIRFLGLCRNMGLKFSVGSDAHHLRSIGRTTLLGPLIEELGLTDNDIWLPAACNFLSDTTEDRH